jgi:hypothetical protein
VRAVGAVVNLPAPLIAGQRPCRTQLLHHATQVTWGRAEFLCQCAQAASTVRIQEQARKDPDAHLRQKRIIEHALVVRFFSTKL